MQPLATGTIGTAPLTTGISGSLLNGGQGSTASSNQAPAPVTVISSDQGKTALSQYQQQHAANMDSISAANDDAAKKAVTTDAQSAAAVSSAKSMGGLTPEEAQTLNIDTSGYDWNSAANMYVPKTGISTDPSKAAADIKAQQDLATVTKAFDVSSATYDGATANLVASIKQLYGNAIADQAATNNSTNAQVSTMGINSGASRYAGSVNGSVLSATAQAGLQKVVDLNNKESAAIAQAEDADSKDQASLFATAQKQVNDIQTERAQTLQTLLTEAQKAATTASTAKAKTDSDSAILKQVAEGITDPTQIFQALSSAGGTQTVGQIASTLRAIAPGGDIAKLTSATQDFYALKGHNQLPMNISSLPDDQQLFAYIAQQNVASKASTSGSAITLSQAKSMGLPLSTVGQTESDIAQSFYSATPPHWFSEKIQSEQNASLTPEAITSAWQTYRQNFTSSSEGTKSTSVKTSTAPKVPAAIVGKARALSAAKATPQEIQDFIKFSGYDVSNPAFSGLFSTTTPSQ